MNNIDPMVIWIALGVLALVIVATLIARRGRRSRSESLREKFGNEYDHAVQSAGNRKAAERELATRVQEVEKHNIRPLNAAEQERYRGDWQRVEKPFIERPTTAVVEADELVADIMRVQGYPMGDFEKHAAHLSVTHPRVVEHYRAGHKVMEGAPGSATTEDLRQAMLHYRSLFEQLSGTGSDVSRATASRADDVPAAVPHANEVPRANEVPAANRDGVQAREEALRADRDRDFR
ncbi:MAG TPA: hypothetical protein VE010_17430 [Thermoanaerobaculia bacterium]|nr:hypothetical protein [Thermoanaerobaculia bacterium]